MESSPKIVRIMSCLAPLSALMWGVTAFAADPAPTFYRDIVPILQEHCQTCHRPEQIAPMSLITYQSVRPWAKAMKAAVLSKKMPPWFADMKGSHSEFLNNSSLKQADVDLIAKWADAGAPEGNAKESPAPVHWPEDGWLIQPDLIVKGPTYPVPVAAKNNVVEWINIVVPGGFTKDTWVTSMELKPDHRGVTHHMCVQFVPHSADVQYYVPQWIDKPRDEHGLELPRHKGDPARRNPILAKAGGIEICYVPGHEAQDYRTFGAGKLIPANTDIVFGLHYTPNGTAVDDTPQLGFTVAKEEPQKQYVSMTISAPTDSESFAIPPHDGNWESPSAQAEFTADAQLVWMMPHMHLRGKDMKYTLIYPNGEKKVILDVPHYDFNWQLGYEVQPINVPKGTKLIVTAHYDNSENNKFNPDPNQTVYFGDMTWEEMMTPFFAVIVDKGVNPKTVLKRGTITGGGA